MRFAGPIGSDSYTQARSIITVVEPITPLRGFAAVATTAFALLSDGGDDGFFPHRSSPPVGSPFSARIP